MDLDVAFVAARAPGPNPAVMAMQLEDVLGLVDAMHLQPRTRAPLRYPVLSSPS
jgi:hypothetical protein